MCDDIVWQDGDEFDDDVYCDCWVHIPPVDSFECVGRITKIIDYTNDPCGVVVYRRPVVSGK